jgi:glycosyltransferase involved in cell wall biosynthesis
MIPIILQTFNRINYTQQVISSIRNHLVYPIKIIIIDNGSTDGTVEYLQLMNKLGIVDHLILNGENKGIAVPKNQGIDLVKQLYPETKYIVITDNDIVPPFVRDKDCKCCLSYMVDLMEKHQEVGMLGVDLNSCNAPDGQSWWWRLRQHPMSNPEFAEIAVGFWFTLFRFEVFKDFSFVNESLYGRTDESIRNYLTLNNKKKIGVWKGIHDYNKHETVPQLGEHLGWKEDKQKFPDYVLMKKLERAKAEKGWKEKGRKW